MILFLALFVNINLGIFLNGCFSVAVNASDYLTFSVRLSTSFGYFFVPTCLKLSHVLLGLVQVYYDGFSAVLIPMKQFGGNGLGALMASIFHRIGHIGLLENSGKTSNMYRWCGFLLGHRFVRISWKGRALFKG